MATLQRITASLYQISLGVVNVFVIKDNGLTLIDTGYQGSMEPVFSALRKGGEDPAALKQIILTHAHPDHAGSAAAIKKELGIPLLAHQFEAPVLVRGTSEGAPIHVSPGVINWLIYQLFIKRGGSAIDPVGVDQYVSDGDILPVAGGLQIVHTPGHSSGHIALWLKQERVLIAGDLCANIAGLDLSTVYEDRTLGVQSIVKVAGLSFDKAVFGHGRLLEPKANQKLNARFGAVRSKLHAG